MSPADAPFHRYLDWKEPIDERSLNAQVRQAFLEAVAALGCRRLRVLDCGTGTGAMIRRLVRWGLPGEVEIVGLDVDANLLGVAADKFACWAWEHGYTLRVHRQTGGAMQVMSIRTDTAEVRVRLYHHDLYALDALEADVPWQGAFDVVSALSLTDLLDEARGLAALLAPLRPQGLVYLLLNYDHETIFEPTPDRSWEAAMIQAHHRVMECRTPGRDNPGASYIGRTLYHLLRQQGCQVLAYGPSDWLSCPDKDGHYPAQEAEFVRQIVAWVYAAGKRCETLDARRVEEWYRGRLSQLDRGELVYICRQNDILGQRPGTHALVAGGKASVRARCTPARGVAIADRSPGQEETSCPRGDMADACS
jgi:SAM-dependent methyltransferase